MWKAAPQPPRDDRQDLPQAVTASVAAKKFGEIIDTLSDRPLVITRYGRAKAFILSPAEYARLTGYAERRRAVKTKEIDEEEWAAIAESNREFLD